MAKRRTKHWHISQWPLHEMIACHYCPFLKKNKSWHFFISQLSNYEHVDGCCHVVANRESDDEITHYSFRQNSMLEAHALFAALSMTAARCFNQMLLFRT
jgi:hypothetical protein